MKKSTSFEEQKRTRYIRGNVYFGIVDFSCLSSTKPCLRFLLIYFSRKIKGFYQSSLGNEVDFRNIMNVSPNICQKVEFQKTETRFSWWKSTENNDIDIFLSLENPCTFLLAKKNIWEKGVFNTNSELPQNHTGKQIMPSKTTINCLFNDIWCYLFIIYLFMIHCWKIGFFQQTVVRFY